jgi:hypothetical protein
MVEMLLWSVALGLVVGWVYAGLPGLSMRNVVAVASFLRSTLRWAVAFFHRPSHERPISAG